MLRTLISTYWTGIFSALKMWKLAMWCRYLQAKISLGILVDASNGFRANLGHPTAGSCSALPDVVLMPLLVKIQTSMFWSVSTSWSHVLCPITQFVPLNSWNKKWDYQLLFCWGSADQSAATFCEEFYNLVLFLEKMLNSPGEKNSLDLDGE